MKEFEGEPLLKKMCSEQKSSSKQKDPEVGKTLGRKSVERQSASLSFDKASEAEVTEFYPVTIKEEYIKEEPLDDDSYSEKAIVSSSSSKSGESLENILIKKEIDTEHSPSMSKDTENIVVIKIERIVEEPPKEQNYLEIDIVPSSSIQDASDDEDTPLNMLIKKEINIEPGIPPAKNSKVGPIKQKSKRINKSKSKKSHIQQRIELLESRQQVLKQKIAIKHKMFNLMQDMMQSKMQLLELEFERRKLSIEDSELFHPIL